MLHQQPRTWLMGMNANSGSRRCTQRSARPNRSISGCSRCTRALSLHGQSRRSAGQGASAHRQGAALISLCQLAAWAAAVALLDWQIESACSYL